MASFILRASFAVACVTVLTIGIDAHAQEDLRLPPHCAVELPLLGDVPANAPALPVFDRSEGYTAQLSLSTSTRGVVTTKDPRFIQARFDAPPPEGPLALTWSLACSSGAAPTGGTWDVRIVRESPLPSGELGDATATGSIASIVLNPASRAFGRLSLFTVRGPDFTMPAETAFYNEVRAESGALAGGVVERIDIGYSDTFRPGSSRAGVLDLTVPLSVAARSVCHGATSGTQSGDVTVEQQVIGQDSVAARSTATVTVDCAKADEAERAIQVVSVDDGCSIGGRARDRSSVGFVALALAAVGLTRARARRARA